LGSIPLPALHLNPVQVPQVEAGQIGQLLALKNQLANAPLQHQALQQQVQAGQLENQQRQTQLNDQQAMTKAMQSWDGKSLDDLTPLVVKNGGSAQAVMGLKAKALEMKEKYSQIAKTDAETGASNIATLMKKNDVISGAFSTVLQSPDETLPQSIVSTAQQLAQQGVLDPQHLQMAQSIAQQPPAQARQALETMRKGMLADSQLLDQAQKTAGIKKDQTQTALNQMEIERGGKSETDKFTSDFLQSHGLANTPENRQKAFKEYTKETKIAPAEVRMSALLQMPTEVADPNNPGETIMVKRNDAVGMKGRGSASTQAIKAEDKYMTSGKGAQQLTAFNTAMQHLDLLEKLGGDLQNSNLQIANKAKQSWAEATGNPAPANFEAAKNAMSGEVAAALKASGATDKEIEKVDGTFGRAQSPMQLKGAIAVYRTLLRSKAHNLQVQFQQGMQGKPAFNDNESAPAAAPSGGDPFAQFGGKAH
jgi:hypothetical protein